MCADCIFVSSYRNNMNENMSDINEEMREQVKDITRKREIITQFIANNTNVITSMFNVSHHKDCPGKS